MIRDNVTPPKISMGPISAKNQTYTSTPTIGQHHTVGLNVVHPSGLSGQLHDTDDEFADFHSAPLPSTTATSEAAIKPVASATDLIGDEDKYAALRTLDFGVEIPTAEPANDGPALESTEQASVEEDDNWADFKSVDPGSQPTLVTSENDQSKKIMSLFDTPASISGTTSSGLSLMVSDLEPVSSNAGTLGLQDQDTGNSATEDGWADFQDFSSAAPADNNASANGSEDKSNTDIVSVKKDRLDPTEIMGLFKVKDDVTSTANIKSRDDDADFTPKPPRFMEKTISESINKLHGITHSSSTPEFSETRAPEIATRDTDEDLFGPPPVDDFHEEDHDDYHRGYDFGDFMKPDPEQQKKKAYGMYGANSSLVVTGHRKAAGDLSKSRSAGELKTGITDTLDSEYDSDSISSKEFDMFKSRLGVSQKEDSQSVASLEFIAIKNVQNIKGDSQDDSQSQSSNEFAASEQGHEKGHSRSGSDFGAMDQSVKLTLSGQDPALESKSVDSLDIRKEELGSVDSQEGVSQGQDRDKGQDGSGEFGAGRFALLFVSF